MLSRVAFALLLFCPVPLPAEPGPGEPDQSVAIALFERLVPGLKITSLGTAEPIEGGGTRFVGENEFEFTTKGGEIVRAKAGDVAVEPARTLITFSKGPSVHLRTHALIATSDETRILYRTDTGKVTASGPHRISIGGIGKKKP